MAITDEELKHYTRIGLQNEIARMQNLLAELDGEPELPTAILAKRRGRAPGKALRAAVRAAAARNGWSDDPEERKAEMARRFAKRREKTQAQQQERAAKSAKISKARKREWAEMSVRQRKQRLAAMEAGKRKKVNGLAVAV